LPSHPSERLIDGGLTMKKILSLFVVMLLMLSFPMALAGKGVLEEESNGDKSAAEETAEEIVGEEVVEEAGITPDSPLYVFDTLLDDIALAFTFDEVEKVKKAIEVAEERLAEAQVMVAEDNLEAAEEAEAEHAEVLEEAEEALEAIESNGDPEETAESLEEVAELQAELSAHAQKVAEVKDGILARKAAQGWDPEKLAHMEEVFNRIKAKAEETGSKAAEKRTKVRTKLKALTESTDAEVDEVEAEIEERVRGRDGREEQRTRVRVRSDSSDEEVEVEERTRGRPDNSGRGRNR